MRAALLTALVLAPTLASAGPFHDIIVQPPHHAAPGVKNFTHVSHTIYLNPCLPNGCTVHPGRDDARTDSSSIPNTQAVLTAYPHGSDSWNSLVQCVKDMYAPFDVQVTDVDPGTAPHFEVMVAGNAHAIGADGAGGVAPFIACDGELEDNGLSFVFAAQTSDLDFLCWAAAQESSHIFGLDHELNAKDPMTYLTPPYKKPGFQNEAADCGEDTPRECWCGGTKQNSYQYLTDLFGPATLEPSSIAITEPADGAWVKPGFAVRAELTSQLSTVSATLSVDGTTKSQLQKGAPLEFTSPTGLAGGDHAITVETTDTEGRQVSTTVNVHVTARCGGSNGSCQDSFACLGGYCLPTAATQGGLGGACSTESDCITGACGFDGTDHLCTGVCDAGGTCPAGFECIDGGTQQVCWPKADTGCSTTGTDSTSPMMILFGLGVVGLIVRRRK